MVNVQPVKTANPIPPSLPVVWVHTTARATVYAVKSFDGFENTPPMEALVIAIEKCQVYLKTPNENRPFLYAELNEKQALSIALPVMCDLQHTVVEPHIPQTREWIGA